MISEHCVGLNDRVAEVFVTFWPSAQVECSVRKDSFFGKPGVDFRSPGLKSERIPNKDGPFRIADGILASYVAHNVYVTFGDLFRRTIRVQVFSDL